VTALDRFPIKPADHPSPSWNAVERLPDGVDARGFDEKAFHDPSPIARVPSLTALVLSSTEE
jgi:hypothetical protein